MTYLSADPDLSRQLAKLDCRRRITWLRDKAGAYVRDLAAGHFLEHPFCFDPQPEAMEATMAFGIQGNLTAAEMQTAFWIEWNAGLELARKIIDRCEAVAARHIQLYRRRDDISLALAKDRKKWPPDWPYVSPDDLEIIAGRFQKHPGREIGA